MQMDDFVICIAFSALCNNLFEQIPVLDGSETLSSVLLSHFGVLQNPELESVQRPKTSVLADRECVKVTALGHWKWSARQSL
jgi:hypothetical protein